VTDCPLTLDITHKTWNQILEKNGHNGAMEWNSTDVKRFNKFTTYVAKYAGKDEDENFIKGRCWGSSVELNIKRLKEKLREIGEFLYAYFIKVGRFVRGFRRGVKELEN